MIFEISSLIPFLKVTTDRYVILLERPCSWFMLVTCWSCDVWSLCPLLQAVWSLALMLPHLTAAPKSCWTLRIRWVIVNNVCRSVQSDVHVQLSFRSSVKSETSISPTSLAISVRKQGICRPRMMWGFCQSLLLRWLTVVMLKAVIFPSQKRQGMDIKQMKAFVSEELKGLKQEHRLLSMREFWCSLLWNCGQTCVSHCPVSFSDISASESIMKTKTSQDFQELLRIEHCRRRRISMLTLTLTVSDLIFSCCSFTWRVWYSWMYFFHRGAHYKTGVFGY